MSADELDGKHSGEERAVACPKAACPTAEERADASPTRSELKRSTGEEEEEGEIEIITSSISPSRAHEREDHAHSLPTHFAPPPPLPPSQEEHDEKWGRGDGTIIPPADRSNRNEK